MPKPGYDTLVGRFAMPADSFHAEVAAQETLATRQQTARSASARTTLLMLCLAVLAFLPYQGRLGGPFVFDDEDAIVQNTSLTSLESALSPPRETPVAGRPLVNLSLAVDYAVHGLDPSGFHRTNLLLHGCCVLLAFAVVRRLLRTRSMPGWVSERAEAHAFLAAALFCVHPMTIELVLYTSQRTESVMAACYLGALWLLLRDTPQRQSWPWALLVSLLGICAKEVYATAPLVLLAFDRAFLHGSARAALRSRAKFYAALASCWVPALLLQLTGPRSDSVQLFSWDYALTQARIVPEYLMRATWPGQPVLDYGQLWPQSFADAWPALAITSLAAIGGLTLAWRRPRIGFIAVWVLLILAPSSSILSVHTEIGADRRFYLPLIGVLVCWVLAASALLTRLLALASSTTQTHTRRLGFALCLVLVLVIAGTTRSYATDFRSVEAFWRAAVQARPQNARAHYNLAETWRRNGQLDKAIASFEAALDRQDSYADAHTNLAGLLLARGQLADGLFHARRGAELARTSSAAHFNLALACALNGQTACVVRELKWTLRLQPGHWDAHRKLAQTYLATGQTDQASEQARLVLAHSPADPLAQHVLSQLAQGHASSTDGQRGSSE